MERISLDHTFCMEEVLGPRGISPRLLEAIRLPLENIRHTLLQRRERGGLAWMELPYRDPGDILGYARAIAGRFDNLVVLGIGGSALGTTALGTALLHPYHNLLGNSEREGRPRLFVVDNVDPDQVAALFSGLDLRTTLFNVISKSGTTAETMAVYLMARRLLEQQAGRDHMSEHLVFTTDPLAGVLRKIGQAEGIQMFDIPAGVGGRFSILSPVGLLPAALTGMDVLTLLEGARVMDQWISGEADALRNPALLLAALQFLQDTHFRRCISVMMPYSARLRDMADWYRQLWAESLGKALNRDGKEVHVGQTPVKALGVTDQHSQIQLYSEGPDDKVITFLRIEAFEQDVVIPKVHAQEEPLGYLSGKTLGRLMNAEQEATAWALSRRGRPSLTISLPRVDAGSVGQLFFLLEVTTAAVAELYDIDAFDQPGVELGKQATFALMGRAGSEEMAAAIQRDLAVQGRYRLP